MTMVFWNWSTGNQFSSYWYLYFNRMHLGCRSLSVVPRSVCAPHRLRRASQLSIRTGRLRSPSRAPLYGIVLQASGLDMSSSR